MARSGREVPEGPRLPKGAERSARARRDHMSEMERREKATQSEHEEVLLHPGYHVVVTRQFSYVVSTVMARHIEREIDRWPRPRWITFVDVAGGRVKVRRELIECLEQSSTETRALWRLWRKQRDNEVPAEFG